MLIKYCKTFFIQPLLFDFYEFIKKLLSGIFRLNDNIKYLKQDNYFLFYYFL